MSKEDSSFGSDFSPLGPGASANSIQKILQPQSQGLAPGSVASVLGGRGGRDRAYPPQAALSCTPFHLGGAPSRVAEATTGAIHTGWECGFAVSVRERKLISEYFRFIVLLQPGAK